MLARLNVCEKLYVMPPNTELFLAVEYTHANPLDVRVLVVNEGVGAVTLVSLVISETEALPTSLRFRVARTRATVIPSPVCLLGRTKVAALKVRNPSHINAVRFHCHLLGTVVER